MFGVLVETARRHVAVNCEASGREDACAFVVQCPFDRVGSVVEFYVSRKGFVCRNQLVPLFVVVYLSGFQREFVGAVSLSQVPRRAGQ